MRWNYICATCGELVEVDGRKILNKECHPHSTKPRKLTPMQDLEFRAKSGEFLNSWKRRDNNVAK